MERISNCLVEIIEEYIKSTFVNWNKKMK